MDGGGGGARPAIEGEADRALRRAAAGPRSLRLRVQHIGDIGHLRLGHPVGIRQRDAAGGDGEGQGAAGQFDAVVGCAVGRQAADRGGRRARRFGRGWLGVARLRVRAWHG